MSKFKSKFLNILKERGFIQDITDPIGLDKEIISKGENFSAYIGFDATAQSLHAGSLTMLMMLRHLINCGHKAVVIIGGATTQVGDPSGKDKTRPVLDKETIEKNAVGITSTIKKILPEAKIVNNNEWFGNWNFMNFLTEISREFSVNEMVKRDVVRKRLESKSNMSFLEFNYMLLQAFDFMKLNEIQGVSLQMGGSDQWGNIVSGIELGRRKNNAKLFGLTSPLLQTANGRKMGKSDRDGVIWLDRDATSVFDFWQFWRNTEDLDVKKFLNLFTDIPMDAIDEMMKNKDINEVKKNLATEVTSFVHSSEEAAEAEQTAHEIFVKKNAGNTEALPKITLKQSNVGILDVLVEVGLCTSNSDARRQIQGGGVSLDDKRIDDVKFRLTDDFFSANGIKLSLGKKKHRMLVLGN